MLNRHNEIEVTEQREWFIEFRKGVNGAHKKTILKHCCLSIS